jgi:ketopantoate reductase
MSDVERPASMFQAAGQDIADEFSEDPDAKDVISAYMGMMYQMALAAGRQVPAVQIIEAARRMASTPDGIAKMRQQLSGQQ